MNRTEAEKTISKSIAALPTAIRAVRDTASALRSRRPEDAPSIDADMTRLWQTIAAKPLADQLVEVTDATEKFALALHQIEQDEMQAALYRETTTRAAHEAEVARRMRDEFVRVTSAGTQDALRRLVTKLVDIECRLGTMATPADFVDRCSEIDEALSGARAAIVMELGKHAPKVAA